MPDDFDVEGAAAAEPRARRNGSARDRAPVKVSLFDRVLKLLVVVVASSATLLASFATVGAFLGWNNPIIMRPVYAADLAALDTRITIVEEAFLQIGGDVQSMKVQSLRSELRKIEIEIQQARPGSSLATLLEGQRDAVKGDLKRAEEYRPKLKPVTP